MKNIIVTLCLTYLIILILRQKKEKENTTVIKINNFLCLFEFSKDSFLLILRFHYGNNRIFMCYYEGNLL